MKDFMIGFITGFIVLFTIIAVFSPSSQSSFVDEPVRELENVSVISIDKCTELISKWNDSLSKCNSINKGLYDKYILLQNTNKAAINEFIRFRSWQYPDDLNAKFSVSTDNKRVIIDFDREVMLVGKQHNGGGRSILNTGSMHPYIHADATFIAYKPFNNELYFNDVVCSTNAELINDLSPFNIDTCILHRIIDIDYNNKSFMTQGDANSAFDGVRSSFDEVEYKIWR